MAFSVVLATGDVIEAFKLVLAFGISDELPAVPREPGAASEPKFAVSSLAYSQSCGIDLISIGSIRSLWASSMGISTLPMSWLIGCRN